MSERGQEPSRLLDWSPRELFGTIVDAKRWGGNAKSWRGGLALVFICLAVYLPGFVTIPTIDRDEARFAQASRQMSASDKTEDWVIPKIQGLSQGFDFCQTSAAGVPVKDTSE